MTQIRTRLLLFYTQIIAECDSAANQSRELVPQLYGLMARLPDAAVHEQYLAQSAVLMNDDSSGFSTKARGVVEGVAIRLGEMMDEPRHVRRERDRGRLGGRRVAGSWPWPARGRSRG